jgi:hypothetical protein
LELKTTEKQFVDVQKDGVVVARFMMAHDTSSDKTRQETYKPYIHVFDPTGALRITKGPGGEYPHHRGIFLGWNINVGGKSFDLWHMTGGDQVVTKVQAGAAGADKVELTADVDWGKKGEPIMSEVRRMTFASAPKPFYLSIDVKSSLKPLQGDATMGGDPEHAGVQFRPSENIDRSKTVYMFPGEKSKGNTPDLPWMAEIMTIEGKTFTVLYMSAPENPKGAKSSAYRNYGRFGAFPTGVAKADAPFVTHYQWLIAEGDVRDAAVFQKAWNAFAKQEVPTPALAIIPVDAPKKEEPKKTDAPK